MEQSDVKETEAMALRPPPKERDRQQQIAAKPGFTTRPRLRQCLWIVLSVFLSLGATFLAFWILDAANPKLLSSQFAGPGDLVLQLACPGIGQDPLVIGENDSGEEYDFLALRLEVFRGRDVLCTLVEMDVARAEENNDIDTGGGATTTTFSRLKPVGRSYNGHGWEAAPGDFSRLSFQCSGSICSVRLPRPPQGRFYVLRSSSYGHELRPDDLAARFLERTTFGPTKTEIQKFTTPEAWLAEQFALPPTSHREFFRKRATDWFYYTWQTGLLHAGPCEAGSRYRSFALTSEDVDSNLHIRKSPLDDTKLILSIGGYIRTVVDGPMQVGRKLKDRVDLDIDEDGTYFQIVDVRTEGQKEGGIISLELPSTTGGNKHIYFGGKEGNPLINFDSRHTQYIENLLDLSSNEYRDILTQFYSGDTGVIEITKALRSSSCDAWDEEVVGFTNPLKFAIARTESNGVYKYWIHSPTFDLLDNSLDIPLADGGLHAVRQTATLGPGLEEFTGLQAKCSNVPRTFVNEESCQLLEADACSYDENADIQDGGKVLVCGSPGEVANHHSIDTGPLGKGGFSMFAKLDATEKRDHYEQRRNVWTEIALHSEDQLRQRMAYALSQILAISEDFLGGTNGKGTENYLTYYDIFVRNAFGNYFDILKEVTYSPMMARMLTYIDGQSTGHAYITDNYVQQADENFAREIMQLFTIGLVLQNDDGSLKLDGNGNEIASYNNLHISEYAKVFVGMRDQSERGNTERLQRNLVDPLRIDAKWKDKFPKLGLNSRYIGDGYPLCSDLPHQYFLKKGARYRILGSKKNPDFTDEKARFQSIGNMLDPTSSTLASILCNKAEDGECNPQSIVILPMDIECHGTECEMSEPRVIQVAEGLWYEYIRPPCVNQVFYNNGKTLYRNHDIGSYMKTLCGNPAVRDAPSACCSIRRSGKQAVILKEIFSGELTTFETAVDRCSEVDFEVCDKIPAEDAQMPRKVFFWVSAPCSVIAKVSPEGSVGIVHQPSEMAGHKEEEVHRSVASDTQSFFRTDWRPTVEFPTIQKFLEDFRTNCESIEGCFVDTSDGNCQCEVFVEDTIAFETVLELDTAEKLLSIATIGAFVPESAAFVSTGTDGIKMFPQIQPLSVDTIFEVTDSFGKVHYRKNVLSIANLGNGSLQMRNPVTFWSLPDLTIRDGEYELDAALEHYFFHPNVPSFIAKRLVQRFGSSNPSPRYIEVIAHAFKTGSYMNTFGSNEYGCLEATIAAILLDREAVDHILDADPVQGQLQGPYMRLMRAMRSSEYESYPDNPIIRFEGKIFDRIGEEPHMIPTVFSFFDPTYVASGRVREANLFAPEAKVLSGQTSISTARGLMSLFKYGVSKRGDSFFFGSGNMNTDSVNGKNTYNPASYGLDPESADDVVDDLATLLTSGRLSPDNRRIIKEVFQESLSNGVTDNPVDEALINAQQLIALSPEFHSNSVIRKRNKNRETLEAEEAAGVPYKAVIQLNLKGGLDSFNVLVPDSCTGTNAEGTTVDEQYLQVRGAVAFDRSKGEFDLKIAPNSEQPCESFAIHEDLPFIKELYDDGDSLFFANVGIVNENNMNTQNWQDKTKARLFSHISMQEETKKIDSYETYPGSGILGRLNDILINKFGGTANSIGIEDNSIALRGSDAVGAPVLVIGRDGPIQFRNSSTDDEPWLDIPWLDIERFALEINSEQDAFSNIFGDTWSDTFVSGIFDGERLTEFISNIVMGLDSETWKPEANEDEKISQKFQTLATMIQTRGDRGVDRDTFAIEFRSFDHHSDLKASLKEMLPEVNRNIRRLVQQLKLDGLWDQVTIVIQSEFGRTISPNSNAGSDHGWGGNYMVLGGNIDGGRVLGKFPDDFTYTSRLNASGNSRLRFIPTTSWDHIYNGIAEWMTEGFGREVTDDDLDYVLPNRRNVIDPVEGEGSVPLFTAADLYESNGSDSRRTTKKGVKKKKNNKKKNNKKQRVRLLRKIKEHRKLVGREDLE